MKQEEIVDRLRKMTGSWDSTFRLLDKYAGESELKACAAVEVIPEAPKSKSEMIEEKVIKFAPKKVRIKKGSVPNQVREILEEFPDSSLKDIAKLGDWDFHDQKHMTSGLSRTLNKLFETKVVVRKKSPTDGRYIYRLVEKK